MLWHQLHAAILRGAAGQLEGGSTGRHAKHDGCWTRGMFGTARSAEHAADDPKGKQDVQRTNRNPEFYEE
eukprot:1163220-Amphidinium_carterae.1